MLTLHWGCFYSRKVNFYLVILAVIVTLFSPINSYAACSAGSACTEVAAASCGPVGAPITNEHPHKGTPALDKLGPETKPVETRGNPSGPTTGLATAGAQINDKGKPRASNVPDGTVSGPDTGGPGGGKKREVQRDGGGVIIVVVTPGFPGPGAGTPSDCEGQACGPQLNGTVKSCKKNEFCHIAGHRNCSCRKRAGRNPKPVPPTGPAPGGGRPGRAGAAGPVGGGGNPSPDGFPSPPPGWYWVENSKPGEVWLASDNVTPAQLIAFYADGSREQYQEFATDEFLRISIWDAFDNQTIVERDPGNGRILSVSRGLIEERFTWIANTNTHRLDVDTYVYADQSATTATHIPYMQRSYLFSQDLKRLLEYHGPQTSYVGDPANVNELLDLNQVTTNRMKRVFHYSSRSTGSGTLWLLTGETLARDDGWSEQRYALSYSHNQEFGWYVSGFTDQYGRQKDVSYRSNLHGGMTVTLQDAGRREDYQLDYCGRRTEVTFTALQDPRAGDNDGPPTPRSLSTYYTYAFAWCDSFQIARYENSAGFTWEGAYNPVSGALVSTRFPSATGVGESSMSYSYSHFLDGTLLETAERDGVGTFARTYQFSPRTERWDLGRKRNEMVVSSQPVRAVNGGSHTVNTKTEYLNDGRVRLSSVNDKVGIEYEYDDDAGMLGTERGLIVNIISGPLVSGGSQVNRSAPETTTEHLLRGAQGLTGVLGFVEARVKDQGPHEVRVNYQYDRMGRTMSLQIDRGNGPSYQYQLDFDRRGLAAVGRLLNLDYTGQAPADAGGNRSNQQYIRADTVYGVAGRPLAYHQYIGPMYANFSGTVPDSDLFNSTYVEYDSLTALPTVTRDRFGEQRTVYDSYGFVYKTEQVSGTRTIPGMRQYVDAAGLKVRVSPLAEDSSGQLQYGRYEFHRHLNGSGLAYRVDGPDRVKIDYRYNSRGAPISLSLRKGQALLRRVSQEVDELGRMTKKYVHNPQNSNRTLLLKVRYNNFSQPEWVEDQFGVRTDYDYDNKMRLTSTSQGGVGRSTEFYPHSRRIWKSLYSNGLHDPFVTEYNYNTAGEIINTVFRGAGGTGLPVVNEFAYDSLGRQAWKKDAEGGIREVSFGADGFGWWERRGVADPILSWAQRTFDSVNNEVRVAYFGGLSETAEQVFGPFGELKAWHAPGESAVEYEYNSLLQLKQVSMPEDVLIDLSYDAMGRVQARSWSRTRSGSASETIRQTVVERAPFGAVKVLEQTDNLGVTRHEYDFDHFMNLTEERLILPGGNTVRTTRFDHVDPQTNRYDHRGRIYRTVVDGIGWRNHFKSDGMIEKVELENAPRNIPQFPTQIGYQGIVPVGFAQGNELVTTLDYDQRGMHSWSVTSDQDGVVDQTYFIRDEKGRVLQQIHPSEDGFGEAWKYDEHGRVAEWKSGLVGAADIHASFDKARSKRHGKINFADASNYRDTLVVQGTVNRQRDYTVNPQRGVVEDTQAEQILYDNLGHIRQVQSAAADLHYDYDLRGRLTQITAGSSRQLVQAFQYDAFGRLVRSTNSGGEQIHRWAGGLRLAEEDQNGLSKLIVQYPGVMDEVLSYYRKEGGMWRGYNLTHQAQGPSALFSETGQKLESYRYTRDGEPITTRMSDGAKQRGSFFGNDSMMHNMLYQKESNMYYVRARWYNPSLGLFHKRDPIFNAHQPGHSFVNEDPVNKRDPLGLQAVSVRGQGEVDCRDCHPDDSSQLGPRGARPWDYLDPQAMEPRGELILPSLPEPTPNLFVGHLAATGRYDLAREAMARSQWVANTFGGSGDPLNPQTCMDCHAYFAVDEFRDIIRFELYPEMHAAKELGRDLGVIVGSMVVPGGGVAIGLLNVVTTGVEDGVEAAGARAVNDSVIVVGGKLFGLGLQGAGHVGRMALSSNTGRAVVLTLALKCGPSCATGTRSVVGSGALRGGQYLMARPAQQLPVFRVSRSRWPSVAENIEHAQRAGHPTILTKGAQRMDGLDKSIPTIGYPKFHRDEYPFAITLEGSSGCWVGHVSGSENMSAGNALKRFFADNGWGKGSSGGRFQVLVVD
ncbi:NucA/NucB deoxyribonuclease domain-containing protein [Oligoflexia bacterium]|nr:NucA/NucB deoxyribonuclease domain-containing protein [Oligoflexia bacterium]